MHLWPGVVLPLVVGIGVTLAASLVPARRATRVPPIAALREGADAAAVAVRPLVTPYLAGLSLLGWASWPSSRASPESGPTTQRLFTIAVGAILSFIGLAMVSRYLIRPLARVDRLAARRCGGGASGRLARENTTRNTGRTAVTAAALMIGIGLVVFFSVLINGFKQSFLGSIDKQRHRRT